MLPFARNDATRFISPTKTPEYPRGRQARWSRPRSATWSSRTASRGWCGSPTSRSSPSPIDAALPNDRQDATEADAFLAQHVVGSHLAAACMG